MSFDIAVWGEPDPWRIITAAEAIDGKIMRLWLPETTGLDSVSVLGAIASRTRQLKLGAGILNIYTRSIPLISMTANTLQLISNDRFCLGLGVSTSNILEWHGLRLEKPVSRLRAAIQNLRQSATSRKQTPFPIYVGTIGEGISAVAGELADGLLLNCMTPEYAKRLVDCAIRGAETAGRHRRNLDIRSALIFSVDVQRDRGAIVRRLAYYGAADSYNRMFKRSGFDVEAERLRKAWRTRSHQDAEAAISDRMIEKLTVTPENIQKVTGSYQSAGVTEVTLVPVNFVEATEYLAENLG